MKAIIVGGGLGGLTCALALRRAGIAVSVLERDTSSGSRSQGNYIGLRHSGLSALESVGVADKVKDIVVGGYDISRNFTFVNAVSDSVLLDVVVRQPSDESIRREYLYAPVDRSALRSILLDEALAQDVDVHFTSSVGAVEQSGNAVGVRTACGSFHEGDVIIGADGVNSGLRKLLIGDPLHYTGLNMISFSCPRNEIDADLFSKIRTDHMVVHVKKSMFVGVTDERIGWSVTWREPSEHQKPFDTTPEGLLSVLDAKTGDWAPRWKDLVALSHSKPQELRFRNIYDRPPLTAGEYFFPGQPITLLGDAAHPMTPFRGEGGNCALTDAVSLGESLASAAAGAWDPVQAVQHYEDEMRPRSGKLVKESHDAAVWNHASRFGFIALTVGLKFSNLLINFFPDKPRRKSPKS